MIVKCPRIHRIQILLLEVCDFTFPSDFITIKITMDQHQHKTPVQPVSAPNDGRLLTAQDLIFKVARNVKIFLALTIFFYFSIPLFYFHLFLGWTIIDSFYVSTLDNPVPYVVTFFKLTSFPTTCPPVPLTNPSSYVCLFSPFIVRHCHIFFRWIR